jgi:hypothetical protein
MTAEENAMSRLAIRDLAIMAEVILKQHSRNQREWKSMAPIR